MSITQRILILLLPSILLPAFLLAQNSVSGKILEAENQPLEFANVLLLTQADSSLVKGTVSDIDGFFQIEDVPHGSYFLEISMIGFQKTTIQDIQLMEQTALNIPEVTLTQGMELDEVEVVARKALYEQKIDRLVVNVSSSIVATGSTALDVLERSPGVIVNRQNNSISLVGKNGVNIMINGKTSYMPVDAVVRMLEGMSADNIESIELITTPPASFDAEGNAGFINIVLKKRTDVGLNGNYSLSGGFGRGFVTNDQLGLNYRKGKVNIFGGYSFVWTGQEQVFTNSRDILFDEHLFSNANVSLRDPYQRNHNVRLGIDLELSKNTILGLLVGGYDNKWYMDAENNNIQSVDGEVDQIVDLYLTERNQWWHQNANMNLNHKFSERTSVSLNFDYLHYRDENPTEYEIEYFTPQGNLDRQELLRSDKVTPIEFWVGKIDFAHKLNGSMKLELGAKAVKSNFVNEVAVETFLSPDWVQDPMLTNVSDLNEEVFAGYASLDYNISDAIGLKVGLRYEYTDSKLDINTEGRVVDRQFGALFPSIFLSHQLHEDHSLGISYARRITRPTFNDMAPFIIFMDPNTFFSGNAGIQPALSNAIKFDYRFKSAILSIQYSVEDSTIARFQERVVSEANKSYLQPLNLDQTRTLSFTLGFPLQITSWWEMRVNLVYAHQDVTGNYFGVSTRNKQNQFQANGAWSFKLPKDFSAELSGNYSGPQLFGGFARLKGTYAINFGLQKNLGDRFGTLSLNVRDIFNSLKWDITTRVEGQDFGTFNTFDFSQRTFTLTYSRNFGNRKVKSARQRQTGSEDERRRVQ